MCSVYPISLDSYICIWSAYKHAITGPSFYSSRHSPSSETFKIPDILAVCGTLRWLASITDSYGQYMY